MIDRAALPNLFLFASFSITDTTRGFLSGGKSAGRHHYSLSHVVGGTLRMLTHVMFGGNQNHGKNEPSSMDIAAAGRAASGT